MSSPRYQIPRVVSQAFLHGRVSAKAALFINCLNVADDRERRGMIKFLRSKQGALGGKVVLCSIVAQVPPCAVVGRERRNAFYDYTVVTRTVRP
jgi:hypothetical protein